MKKDILQSETGTYVLVFQCLADKRLQIGKWGRLRIKPGFYLYVGSAFGPGGIKARVARHQRSKKAKHWHIDYLREHMVLSHVWFSYDNKKLEHQWAQSLSGMPAMQAIQGFGCSDCQCYSHLFSTVKSPSFKRFSNTADGRLLSSSFS